MRLYLIRHGESTWNAEQRSQGRAPVPLSNRGRRQAERTADRLRGRGIGAILSSDLVRTRETADIISAVLDLPVTEITDLRERHSGVYEGLTFDQITARYPDWQEVFETMDGRAEGGESHQDVWDRAAGWLEAVRAAPPAETLAVVTHGGPIRALIAYGLGMPRLHAWRFRVDNCSLTVVDWYETGVIVNALNDIGHIQDLIDLGDVAW